MFLFLLLFRVFDDADQLFVLGIFERPFDRDEALGVFVVNPVTSRTESLVRACRFRFPGPPPFLKEGSALCRPWAPRAFPSACRCRVGTLDTFRLCGTPSPDGILECVDMLRRTLLG